jgi:DUF4097 and DUF4098 domain-containing protein YvlB
VVALLVLFCCAAVLLLGVAAYLVDWPVSWPDDWAAVGRVEGAPESQTFEVGSAPELRIDTFAGPVTVREGEKGEITVVATKHARRTGDLERIEVVMKQRTGTLVVETVKPRGLMNAWVEFEITAPADTYLDVHTGSGSIEVSQVGRGAALDTGSGQITVRDMKDDVEVHTGSGSVDASGIRGSLQVSTGSGRIEIDDVQGEIDAHTGSGGINVRNVSGWIKMETGSGSIDYEGTPESLCHARTGSGGITLRLPADLDGRVDLHSGSGSVDADFDVDGHVTRQDIRGSIGSGGDLSIYAHTGSGSVDVISR